MPPAGLTAAASHDLFGPLPPGRVLTNPGPGTATAADFGAANRRGDGLYELTAGVLIRKASTDLSSWLGGELSASSGMSSRPAASVICTAHGGSSTRPADCSPRRSVIRPPPTGRAGCSRTGSQTCPRRWRANALAPDHTRREMERKRAVYFAAGVRVVWEADPVARTVVVWTAPDAPATLTAEAGDTLTGGAVLPGFAAPPADLF